MIRDLNDWADEYDRTLNHDDPAASGFASAQDEARFKERGVELARRLQDELGPGIEVFFQP